MSKTARIADLSGFTLIEILVVLVITGLLAGIAFPRLQQLVRSMEMSGQRENILSELEGLGYHAYANGKPIHLTSLPDPEAEKSSEPALHLPAGWRLDVAQAIEYAYNGVCSGGKITLIAPDKATETFRLTPPLCRLEPAGENTDSWR